MFTSKTRSTLAALTATFALAVSAAPATAQDNNPNGPPSFPGACPVEDENGNVTYVPPGTKIGPLICGPDGEWKIVLATTKGSKKTPKVLVDAPVSRVVRAR